MNDRKLLLAGLLAALVVGEAGAVTYSFTTLDAPGARITLAADINNSGQVTGYYLDASGRYRSFVESGGTFTTHNVAGFNNYAHGINDNGQVTGWYEMQDPQDCWGGCGPDSSGFVESGATVTTLHFPYIPGGSAPTALRGINDSGQVTGYYLNPLEDWRSHGFVASGGKFTTVDPPGAVNTAALGINDKGEVTGRYQDTSGRSHGFVQSGGAFTTIDVPGAFSTIANGINNTGQVAGFYQDAAGRSHGFVESDGAFVTLDVPGALNPFYSTYPGTSAYGINDRGQVAGYYSDALGTHGFIASIAPPVPEPEEWAMILVGLGLVGFQVRRKHANNGNFRGSCRLAG